VPRGGGTSAAFEYAALAIAGWPAYRYLAPTTRQRAGHRVQWRHRLVLASGVASVLAVIAWHVSIGPIGGPGALVVDVLDVGQGDAILLTTPHGHQVLVDTGPSGIGLARELGAVLPHWDHSIDTLVVTHGDEDHVAGSGAALLRYDFSSEIDNGGTRSTQSFGAYLRRAQVRHATKRGDEWTDDGVRFQVLWPPPDYETTQANDASVVLRVTYGGVRVLLTGDFEASAQHALMALDDVGADILKVPHHGSKTSAPDFFAAVAPSVAVISVGKDNRYGHPAPETVAALSPAQVLRTDLSGRVRLRITGGRIAVETER
jgi:competence protein ComEC